MDGIFLTDFNSGNSALHQRGLGAYHMASVLRQKGLHVFVLDMVNTFNNADIANLVSKLISEKTRFIGLSTTFMFNKLQDLDFDIHL